MAKPQATHKEILQQRFDDAEHVYREGAEEVSRLTSGVNAERKSLETLEGEYNQACRAVANGDSVDLNLILAEKERRTPRLRGMEMLLKEAEERFQPLHDAFHAASQVLQAEVERLEIERLKAALEGAKQERTKAQSALEAAHQVVRQASYELDQFEHKIKIAKKQELAAQGLA